MSESFEEKLTEVLTYLRDSYEKDIENGIKRLLNNKEITTDEYLQEMMRVGYIKLYINRILVLVQNQDDLGSYAIPCIECMAKVRTEMKKDKDVVDNDDEEEYDSGKE